VFRIYITTNTDFALHKINWFVFFNRDEKCLLRGTNLVFKWNSLRFVFKGLTHGACVLSIDITKLACVKLTRQTNMSEKLPHVHGDSTAAELFLALRLMQEPGVTVR
jgi:hypothetical protein